MPRLADNSCYSFESCNFPGRYQRHYSYRIRNDGSPLFAADVTFCAQPGDCGSGVSWRSYNHRDRFLRRRDDPDGRGRRVHLGRHDRRPLRRYNTEAWIASSGGPLATDAPAGWPADGTWNIADPYAP